MRITLFPLLFIFFLNALGQEPDSTSTEKDYVKVEQMPEYPGGLQALYSHLGKNMRYPAEARRMGIEGRVYIEFIVDKDGSLIDQKVLKGVGSGLDEEALRVFKTLPEKFQPGTQRGKPIKVRMVLPVYFKLAKSKTKKNKRKG